MSGQDFSDPHGPYRVSTSGQDSRYTMLQRRIVELEDQLAVVKAQQEFLLEAVESNTFPKFAAESVRRRMGKEVAA